MSKESALNGLKWTTFANVSQYIISFVLTIILARYLTLREYGITASFSIFTILSKTLIDGGLSVALVQKKNANEKHFNSVFWFNLIVSITLYVIIWFLAPKIGDFLKENDITMVIRIISLVYISNALGISQNAILLRELNFKKQTILNLISLGISVIVALYCIYLDLGVYCIVYQLLAQSVILNILLTLTSNWLPSFSFCKKSFLEMWHLGSRVLTVNLLNAVYTQLDGIFIGRLFQLRMLGIYSRGKNFTQIVNSIYVNSIQTLTFSLLSKSKNEDNDTKFKFQHKMIFTHALFLLVIICALISTNSEGIIRILYGDKWINSSFYLSWIIFSLIPIFISTMSSQSLLARGAGREYLKLFLFRKTPLFTTFILGYFMGLELFVISSVILNIFLIIIDFYFLSAVLNIPIKYYLKKVIKHAVYIPVLFIPAMIFSEILSFNIYSQILLTTASQVLLLILICEIYKIDEYKEIKGLVIEKIRFAKKSS